MSEVVRTYDLEALCENADENRTHYYLKCPLCASSGYNKKKLYIKKDFSIGWCFHCNTSFQSPIPENQDDMTINEGFRLDESADNYKLFKLPQEKLFIPEILTNEDRGLLDKRNPYLHLLDYAGIKSYKDSFWIPYYINDELIYYQRRLKHPINDMKYYNPMIEGGKPLYVPPGMRIGSKIILVEGVFDALAAIFLHADKVRAGFTPVAVMGKTLTSYHLWLLNNLSMIDEVIYQLDKTELSLELHEKCGRRLHALSYQYVPSNGADPEEILRSNQSVEYIQL